MSLGISMFNTSCIQTIEKYSTARRLVTIHFYWTLRQDEITFIRQTLKLVLLIVRYGKQIEKYITDILDFLVLKQKS